LADSKVSLWAGLSVSLILQGYNDGSNRSAFVAFPQVSRDRLAARPCERAAHELEYLSLRMSVLRGHLSYFLISLSAVL
jgi:hypothetical protein